MKSAEAILDRVERACRSSGRGPGTVRLLGACKKQPAERINEFIRFMNDRNVRALIGENYVQEAREKRGLLEGDFELHCIGHLQSNKASDAAELFDCVQTVDSEKLARAIATRAVKAGKIVKIFIQVNVSDDGAKSGVSVAEAPVLAAAVSTMPGIKLEGLMTIPRLYESPSGARGDYALLRGLSAEMNLERCELSMGMSDDFEIAIEEGATIVRVGSALFGSRI